MKRLLSVAVILLFVGCSKRDSSAPPTGPSTLPVATDLRGPTTQTSEVLVDVNGSKLYRHEADLQVRLGLSALNSRKPIPQEALPQVQMQTFKKVIDQFVTIALLRQEADRQAITVTEQEITGAMDAIQKRLPPGQTLEDVLKNNPMGPDRMKEDIVTGLRINRLIEPLRTNLLPVTDQQVKEFYDDTRRARHILIKTSDADDVTAREIKKKKAEDLRDKVVKGGDFAELARANSDCPSSQRGGDLGVFPKGRMDPVFEKAAFALKVNEISPVIESRFGYHIIQAQELGKGRDDVPGEDQVRRYLESKQQDAMLADLVGKLKTTATITYSPALPPFIVGGRPAQAPATSNPQDPAPSIPITIPRTEAPPQKQE